MEILKLDYRNIPKIVRALKKGAVIVFPTDTVYGLGGDATSKEVVARIAKIKKRPSRKPFPILVADIFMAKKYARIPEQTEVTLKGLWPGALTAVLPGIDKKLPVVAGRRKTIGVRIPDHSWLRKLIQKLGKPLVGTSANISGKKPLRSAKEALKIFGPLSAKPDIIIDGGTLRGKPSRVIDFTQRKPRVLRE